MDVLLSAQVGRTLIAAYTSNYMFLSALRTIFDVMGIFDIAECGEILLKDHHAPLS